MPSFISALDESYLDAGERPHAEEHPLENEEISISGRTFYVSGVATVTTTFGYDNDRDPSSSSATLSLDSIKEEVNGELVEVQDPEVRGDVFEVVREWVETSDRFQDQGFRESVMLKAFLQEAEGELFPDDEMSSRRPPVATVKADFDIFRYPMFKRDQPEIGAFSQASPENMAKLIIFVICSQQTEWPRLNALFPIFWDYFVSHGGNMEMPAAADFPPLSSDLNHGNALKSALSWWQGRRKQIEFVWNNRSSVYTGLMRAVDADSKNGDTGFLVYRKMILVPGLGVPKAGFAVQLLIGKVGCIDSVNLNVLGVNKPSDIMNPGGAGFKSATAVSVPASGGGVITPSEYSSLSKVLKDDKKELLKFLYGELTKSSFDVLRGYADYLADLADKGTTSEVIWNIWCEIIANKIHHFGGKPIDVQLPSQSGTSRVKSYKGSSQDQLAVAQSKLPSPWNSKAGADVISADHSRLIRGESVNENAEKLTKISSYKSENCYAFGNYRITIVRRSQGDGVYKKRVSCTAVTVINVRSPGWAVHLTSVPARVVAERIRSGKIKAPDQGGPVVESYLDSNPAT